MGEYLVIYELQHLVFMDSNPQMSKINNSKFSFTDENG